MVRLYTTLYSEKNLSRLKEYQFCLRTNLECPHLNEICILVEGENVEIPTSAKLRVRKIVKRPTYQEYFQWINETVNSEDVSIIANTDIWFDGSIGAVKQKLGPKECYAMARWDVGSLCDRNDSQDCWIFRGKIKEVRANFQIGVVRCDNRILFELQNAGYRVLNPAFSIRAFHCHAGERAEYGETETHFIQPPYRYLWSHNLLGPIATLWHNLRFPECKIGWRFDRRKIRQTWPLRAWNHIRRRWLS